MLPTGHYKDLNAFINAKIKQAFKKEKKNRKKSETKTADLNVFKRFKKLEVKDSDNESGQLKETTDNETNSENSK